MPLISSDVLLQDPFHMQIIPAVYFLQLFFLPCFSDSHDTTQKQRAIDGQSETQLICSNVFGIIRRGFKRQYSASPAWSILALPADARGICPLVMATHEGYWSYGLASVPLQKAIPHQPADILMP